MKVFAIIVAVCLLFTSTGNLLESLQAAQNAASMECCTDRGCSCCPEEDQQQDPDRSCEDGHPCGPICHCSSGLQFSALAYEFMEPVGLAVQIYRYSNYVNIYNFEYSGDFLQPPRKV